MKADRRLEAEAKATLSEFAAAFDGHHSEKLVAMFAPHTEMTIAGAGKAEKLRAADLKTHFEHQWKTAKAAPLRFEGAKVTADGSSVVVAADTTLGLEAGAEKTGRFAKLNAGLEKHGEKWLINKLSVHLPEAEAAHGKEAKAETHGAAGAHGGHGKASRADAHGDDAGQAASKTHRAAAHRKP